MIEPTDLPAPKIAETRFQSKIPTKPQFNAPTKTSTNEMMFAIAILIPPLLIICAEKAKKYRTNFFVIIFNKNSHKKRWQFLCHQNSPSSAPFFVSSTTYLTNISASVLLGKSKLSPNQFEIIFLLVRCGSSVLC